MTDTAHTSDTDGSNTAPGLGVIGYLYRPFARASVWKAALYNLTDIVVAWAATVVIVGATVLSTGFIPLAAVVVPVTLIVLRAAGRPERARVRTLLGVDVEPPPERLRPARFVDKVVVPVKDVFAWRAVGYFVMKVALGNLAFFITIAALWGSIALITMPLWLSDQRTVSEGVAVLRLVIASLGGLVVLAAAPRVITGVASLSGVMARALLGPISEERIKQLEGLRSSAVRAVDVDRRRIEQDLHDGAQVRLTALALQIGLAREAVAEGGDKERVSGLLDEAHAQAKQALREIRDLARGIHPAILTDRGLNDALVSMVGRLPIPIDLEVEVHQRPSPEIESVVYFVAAEAVTNAVRHSDSPTVGLRVVRSGEEITVEVRDRGRGGADPEQGTGLANLRERVEAAGGRMVVQSPEGVGTLVKAVVPCD